MYDFKIRETLSALSIKTYINIAKERFRHRAKVANVISVARIKFKIYYDVKHQFLFLKSSDKTFLRLNHKYFLLEKLNSKFFN